MAVKLIAFDFDDTLLNDQTEIPQRNLCAISKAQKEGKILVPASGRLFRSLLRYLKQMDVHGPVITCNGAQVVDCDTEKVLFSQNIPHSLLCKVLTLAQEEGIYAQIYRDGGYYFDRDCVYSQNYEKTAGIKGETVGNLLAYAQKAPFDPQKVLLISEEERIAQLLPVFQKALPELMVMISKANFIEITHPSANKGEALRAIAESYGFTREEVMAIGDSGNDRTMLEYAFHSVAMANGREDIKALCRYQTLDNNEGGVGAAIERWAL